MKVYGSTTSPYVRKVRVLIAEKSIDCPFVVEDPWQSRPEFHGFAPVGKVPALVCDDGQVLFDSLLVLEYLDALSPGMRLIPAEGPARWTVLRWHALGHALIDAVVARLLETRRPEQFQMADRMKREEDRVARILAHCEATLPDARYVTGSLLSVGDIALGVALSYLDFRYPHDWRTTAPRLARWGDEFGRRPSMTATLPPGATPPA